MRKVLPVAVLMMLVLPAFGVSPSREGAALFTPPTGWNRMTEASGTRYVSPDQTASFTIGHAEPFDGTLGKALEGLLEEPKKLPQYLEESRQRGGAHDASRGEWVGAVYSYADTARNAYAYVWVALVGAGGRAVPVTATFSNQKAYNTHGNTIAKVVNAMTLTTTVTLERGNPALTQYGLDETNDFVEWLMQTPLTVTQKMTLETELRGYWKTKAEHEIEGITELLAARDALAKLKPAERDLARQAILDPALEEWRKDTTNPAAKMMVTIYETAHKPIAPGDPPLTRQSVEAFAEYLYFAAAQATGAPAASPTAEVRSQLAEEVSRSYGTMDKEQRELIASMPLVWAALRVAWPELAAADKEKYVAGWKNTAVLVQLGESLKPAEAARAGSETSAGAGGSGKGSEALTAAQVQGEFMKKQMALQMQQRHFQMMQQMLQQTHDTQRIMISNLGGNTSYQYRW